ncbi:Ger(x)C family spore germination protein [Clostridium chrysemydis]|uniref:Ger(x)C family spore germination protein n=1 Tax=Clostridium chrysemydis TaxID=2665504 RepID=UPI003F2F8630
MKRKISKVLLIVFILPLIISGCYNYREINLVTFTTSIIFDIDDVGNVITYMDCVRPYRNENESSDSGKRIIYKGKGKTALEAIRDLNMAASYKINFTQNRALIFTETAARQGIDKFLSLINNDQEFQAKPYAFVYFGDVDELLNITASDEEYLGVFLNDLVQKNKVNSRTIATNISDYLAESQIGSDYALLGALELREDLGQKRVELKGGVLMKNSVMLEKIDVTEGLSYNFLMDNLSAGTLEIPNPQMKDGFITLEILNNKTKTDIEYNGSRVLLTKKIKTRVVLAEEQGRFIYNREAIKNLEEEEEKRLALYLHSFFDKFNKKNIDILGIEHTLEKKYPKLIVKNILSKIDLKIDVDVNIEGSNRVKNSTI